MKSRRGLSSVVGTVFAIIALATVITYVTYSMNTLQQFNQEVMVKNTELIDQGKEEFNFAKAEIVGSKFNITVQNTGTLPINITRLYIENKTNPAWGTYKYDIKTFVSTGGLATNIGQNIDLTALDTQSYKIKLVTAKGNDKEVLMNYVGEAPLYLQLHVLPDSLPNDFTTTVLLAVTNNMSSKTTLLNIVPTVSQTAGVATTSLQNLGPDPPKYSSLATGDTAYFKWIYKISGVNGDTAQFTASLNNGYPGNTASATVRVTDVSFSIQSGSAIESQGLSTTTTPDDTLILHQETTDALTGRQMYSGTAENALTIRTNATQTSTFFTKNDTLEDVDIVAGKWNATLRMVSYEVPDIITTPPDVIYHFETETSNVTPDSSGNTRDMNLPGGGSSPSHGLVGQYGRDGTYGYLFSGSQYMEGKSPLASGIDDVKSSPDTTAGWFKTTTTSYAKRVIYRVGNTASEYYEIVLGDGTATNGGRLLFNFATSSGGSPPQGRCSTSINTLNNTNWQHFTAVRDGASDCKIYINGTQYASNAGSCSGCSGTGLDVDPAGKVTIGRNPIANATGDNFVGQLDQIFHWNAYALSQTQASALYNTNYGIDAHKMTFKLEKVDAVGNLVSGISNDPSYSIPFWDGKGNTTAWSTNDINYTFNSPSGHKFANGERLKFTISWISGLNMSLRIDDPALTNPRSTYIQMPAVDEAFPSYFILHNTQTPKVTVYNNGPYGSWITYLTRIVFDDIASTDAYAGPLRKACGSTIDKQDQLALDSPLIKVGTTCELEFEIPENPPNALTGQSPPQVTIVPGQYRGYVFMSGYDETGNIFLRTSYVGLVRVVNP